jgi:hypothetical protein
MNELIERILPRLSEDERRVLSLPTIQLAMLGGAKGVTVERHQKVPGTTIRSLKARGLVRAGIDTKSRTMPLSDLGVRINEALVTPRWPCGHPRTLDNTQSVGSAGVRCRECRRKIARESARRAR